MLSKRTAALIAAACSWKASNAQELVPVVEKGDQSLLCGDPPIALGTVAASIEGENLEVGVELFDREEKCKIIESHICNVPVPNQAGDDLVSYSIPVETVYDFVCAFETDVFVVAGHVTIQCETQLVGVSGSGSRRLEQDTGEGGNVYAAYYEIPISCEESCDIGTEAEFLDAVLEAEIVPLNHLWSEKSPINPFNPGYNLSMVDTHEKTVGFIPGLSFASDAIEFSGQHGGPTIDAIGHIGQEGILFGGVPAEKVETPHGLVDFGIDKYPESKYVNRGVLIDVARCKGVDRLAKNFVVTGKDLEECAAKQNVHVEAGDSVLIRVGYGPLFTLDPETYLGNDFPGAGEDAAKYLVNKGIFLAGIDNLSLEHFPFAGHKLLLAQSGIYIAENFLLEELSKKCADLNTWEFSLVVNPLKIFGATGMALNVFAMF